jgi:hypothetical protein
MSEGSFSQLGIDGLEEQARLANDNAEVRQRLIDVLKGRRQSPRVKKLWLQLEELDLPHSESFAVVAQMTTAAPKSQSRPAVLDHEHPPNADVQPRAVSPDEYESLLQKYESLRATFTAEAELLARWGMTAAMPLDLQDLVFDEWRKRISRAPSHAGPSGEALSEDRIRIVRERVALPAAPTASGLIPRNTAPTVPQ